MTRPEAQYMRISQLRCRYWHCMCTHAADGPLTTRCSLPLHSPCTHTTHLEVSGWVFCSTSADALAGRHAGTGARADCGAGDSRPDCVTDASTNSSTGATSHARTDSPADSPANCAPHAGTDGRCRRCIPCAGDFHSASECDGLSDCDGPAHVMQSVLS